MGHTRFSPLDQINRTNFEQLEQAWIWRSDTFGPNLDYFSRSTPIYVDGICTRSDTRRQVIAMDPATGETLWTFREPETIRHQRSPRQAYKASPMLSLMEEKPFLSPHLGFSGFDVKTGLPPEGGESNFVGDTRRSGVIDLIPHLVEGWGPWEDYVVPAVNTILITVFLGNWVW